jgi:predicted amidophosphoribosyltransferase/predicted  nucleic acid-binding Zn-ribbon protein
MSPLDPTQSTGSHAGPSPEWRALFEVWKDRSFDLAIPPERLSPDSRRLISSAGALCHAIVMGEVRPDVAPESASLLDVARGWAAPATPLQQAWLEYQDLCLSNASRLHADAEQDLRTAEARLLAAKEHARNQGPDAVPAELVRNCDDANAAAARAQQSLPQVISTLEAERKRALSPVDEALNVASASLDRLETDLADATTALHGARHRYKDAQEKLIRRRARKLGAQVPSEVEQLLEQRRTAESASADLERVVVDLKARIDQERERIEHLQATRDAEERRFNDRVSQARIDARHLRQQADGVQQQIAALRDRAARLLAQEVQKEAHAVTVAQNRIAELSPGLMPLGEVAGPHPRKRESFAYLHLRSNRPLSAHHSSFPSILDGFESRGVGLWTIRGQPCHKDALQLAFPEAVQGEMEPTEQPYVTRWTLDAGQVPARDRERIEPLLTAMHSVLCCSTSLDAYFALDWYKAHDEATAQWHNSKVGEMVYQAKYHGRRDLVATLAARLSTLIRVHPIYSGARLVAAVPCLPNKQYDLPRHLCATLAPLVKKVDATGALHKVRETKPMKDIDNHAEKLANVSQAFRADALSIAGDDVVIIDDTYGSGTTLWEVARTLRNAGARRVLGITCAKNRGFR